MDIPVIKDNIKLKRLSDLITIHLYIKIIEKDVFSKFKVKFTDRELRILANLYIFGGVFSKEDIERFTLDCKEKEICDNPVQSIRNVLGKGRSVGIVKRSRVNKWVISNDYLPKIDSEFIVFNYGITNALI